MATFHGIQVYEILENGNLLNAIYTNTANYVVENEIAKKISPLNTGITGSYNARYIETGQSAVTECILKITARGEAYDFEWTRMDTSPLWKGIGLMAGSNHIAVSYIDTKNSN